MVTQEASNLVCQDSVLSDREMHYCPGCGHGIANRLIAEVLVELGLKDSVVCAFGIGCCNFIDQYLNIDTIASLHGRAPAVATGIKRALGRQSLVFTYQGDGDAISIGFNELIHGAARGEKITTFVVNNSLYGMTGGQASDTTLLGQKTATTPTGRSEKVQGYPIRAAEILAKIEGDNYICRVAVSSPTEIRKAKRTIRKAFQHQLDNRGFSYVEILSPCPTGVRLNPVDTMKWVKSNLTRTFPLGEYKNEDTRG